MLNVVLASDENYVPLLSVCLISLVKNNYEDFNKINVYILENHIQEDSKDKLRESVRDYDVDLNFISTDIINELPSHTKSMDKNDNVSFAPYSRLFVASLLPEDVDKVLYLDVDSLIVDSFKELWDKDLSKYSCGAVIDECNSLDIRKTIINLKESDEYYNSGVLLINLKYWREHNIETKFVEYLVEMGDKIPFHDQDVLNYVLKDTFLTLDPKYNFVSIFHEIPIDVVYKLFSLNRFYDKKEVKNALENPTFIHFDGGGIFRPWNNKNLRFRPLYEEYAKLSPFYDKIFINENNFSKSILLQKKVLCSKLFSYGIKLIPANVCDNVMQKREVNIVNNKIK